ncbi:MAG: acetyl-CoA carboxylase biotin carboxyl carrier protein subunit [Muribaculaceae bacterium]|nr:acetyl-CoA carboxylase biotin carboxyl carrier protein subunit [Muribaculaceae bacterium]
MKFKEYKYKINGTLYTVGIGDVDGNNAEVRVNGTPYHVEIEQKAAAAVKVAAPRPAAAPRTATGEKVISKPAAAATGDGKAVKAPLPGVVLDILVSVGQQVTAADTVVTLEAMKMENSIKAGVDGKVLSINVAKGDSVLEGAALVTIG